MMRSLELSLAKIIAQHKGQGHSQPPNSQPLSNCLRPPRVPLAWRPSLSAGNLNRFWTITARAAISADRDYAATREETITAFKDSVDSGLIGWTNHSESIFGVRDSRPEVRSVNVAFVPFGITP